MGNHWQAKVSEKKKQKEKERKAAATWQCACVSQCLALSIYLQSILRFSPSLFFPQRRKYSQVISQLLSNTVIDREKNGQPLSIRGLFFSQTSLKLTFGGCQWKERGWRELPGKHHSSTDDHGVPVVHTHMRISGHIFFDDCIGSSHHHHRSPPNIRQLAKVAVVVGNRPSPSTHTHSLTQQPY